MVCALGPGSKTTRVGSQDFPPLVVRVKVRPFEDDLLGAGGRGGTDLRAQEHGAQSRARARRRP